MSSDGDAEMYVTRKTRARRPRPVDPDRVAKDPGRELKRIRRLRRLSIEQVAAETRIGARYLEALESNATAEAFPAAAYSRAFLREYARFLRVDPEPFLSTHPATHQEPPPVALGGVLRPPVRGPFRLPRWLLTAFFATVLFTVLVSTGGRDHPTVAEPYTSPVAQTSTVPAAAAGPDAATAPDTAADPAVPGLARDIAVELRIEGAPCWVRATADGKLVSEQTLRSGGVLAIHGVRTVDVVLGNAGSARLVINGRPFEIGSATGRVVVVRMVLENGSVRTSLERPRRG